MSSRNSNDVRIRVAACALLLCAGLSPIAAAADPGPRLVRVTVGPGATLTALLGAGLDVVAVRGAREALVLEWPGDEATIEALGMSARIIDQDHGATLARRSLTERAAHPWGAGAARKSDVVAPRAGHAHPASAQSLPPFGSGSMAGYWTGDEIKMKLDQLVASDVNDVVADKIDTLGTSRQGRPIWGLKLGKSVVGPDPRPVVFYNALTHAREPEGMQALFYFVDDLLSKYGSDSFATSLLDQRVIYIVPLVNPDGYQINVNTYINSGGASFGFWRKNARDNDANGLINNQDGVDINRNYGYKWGLDNIGSSGNRASEVYRGPSAFSEPETQAERDIVSLLKPRTGLSFHTYSDLMLYPWGYTPAGAPDSSAFQEWTDAASIGDGYQTGQGTRVLYEVNGEFNDWTYGDTLLKPRAFTWTPEVGNPNDDFYPPPSRIVPLAAENLRRCYTVAALAGAFVRIEHASWLEGELDIGALAHLAVRARNLGLAAAGPGLKATLISLDPGIGVFSGPIDYPTLPSRQSGDAISGATFVVASADTVTPGRVLRLELDFSAPGGLFSRDTVEVPAGHPTLRVADDATSGLGAWSSVGGWGISPGDAVHAAPYFADSPSGFYAPNANATLTLASPIDLSAGVHAYAEFGTRWDIETGYDAAIIEASLDDSTWTQVTGRATAIGVPSTQPVGSPIYEGTRQRWAFERADLSRFAGPAGGAVHLRFRLTSDGGAEYEGFNFDSLRVTLYDPASQPAPLAVGDGPPVAMLELAPPAPNPAVSRARFVFALPQSGAVRLEVLDLAGRIVRRLASGPLAPGRYARGWDLSDEAGRRVPPGIYFARLEQSGRSLTRRLAIVR
ncbi:MAG: immune inhibitor A [Candidatus Eisenbacteria bacterium]|nr:immune inhibitor A [Candidatus Eisenbacteria bacterium]